MELKVDIGFDQLLHAIQQLPDDQLSVLKDKLNKDKAPANRDDLRTFLLNGPVLTKEQLKGVADARKQINQWRTK